VRDQRLKGEVSEKEWQSVVVRYARLRNWLCYHTFDSRRSAPGFPDLVLVHTKQRRVLFVELKAESGKPSLQQTLWLNVLRACPGVETYLFRPSDWDEVRAVLDGKTHT
jgi:hypothetical protein